VSGIRFTLLLLVTVCVVVAVAFVVTLRVRHAADQDCQRRGAHRVSTGQGRYLCISPDGRVVGP
jgi:hypothetical protein